MNRQMMLRQLRQYKEIEKQTGMDLTVAIMAIVDLHLEHLAVSENMTYKQAFESVKPTLAVEFPGRLLPQRDNPV